MREARQSLFEEITFKPPFVDNKEDFLEVQMMIRRKIITKQGYRVTRRELNMF